MFSIQGPLNCPFDIWAPSALDATTTRDCSHLDSLIGAQMNSQMAVRRPSGGMRSRRCAAAQRSVTIKDVADAILGRVSMIIIRDERQRFEATAKPSYGDGVDDVSTSADIKGRTVRRQSHMSALKSH
jgi:hypothetical protein